MKNAIHRSMIVSAMALTAIVTGCNSPQLVGDIAASATAQRVSPDTLAKLSTACRAGDVLIRASQMPGVPDAAKTIGSFVGAYCGPLLAGQVPATTDANTANWLPQNLASLRALLGV